MIRIRPARENEMDEVKDFIRRIFPEALVMINDEDTIFVAEQLGQFVGFAHLIDEGDRFILQGIGVDDSVRGQGVGTTLLEHVISLPDDGKDIYLKVKSLNPAIDLYCRYGFFLKKFGEHSHILVKKTAN